jgi:hypothetical protein
MHIILGIVGVLTFIFVWYSRLKMLGDAAKGGKKVFDAARNLPRKRRFAAKSGKGGLDVVDDPREAATIVMLEIALARGALTDRQEAALRAETMLNFELDEKDADTLITQAGWLARDAGASHVVVGRMTDFLCNVPGMGERNLRDLESMIVNVVAAGGSATPEQEDLLAIFRQKAAL